MLRHRYEGGAGDTVPRQFRVGRVGRLSWKFARVIDVFTPHCNANSMGICLLWTEVNDNLGICHSLHSACWPTSSRHVRLSAACLVEATSINNLKGESTSMRITKKEIMSLRLADEMIFSLRARSRIYHVGFYTIPYIRAHIFGVGSANARKRHCLMPERISPCTRSLCTWWTLDGKYL